MKLCLQNCGYRANITIKFYLSMSSKNFEEIFHLIKDGITNENTIMRELVPLRP